MKRFLITGWLLSDKVKLETMHCMDVCLSEQEERPSWGKGPVFLITKWLEQEERPSQGKLETIPLYKVAYLNLTWHCLLEQEKRPSGGKVTHEEFSGARGKAVTRLNLKLYIAWMSAYWSKRKGRHEVRAQYFWSKRKDRHKVNLKLYYCTKVQFCYQSCLSKSDLTLLWSKRKGRHRVSGPNLNMT